MPFIPLSFVVALLLLMLFVIGVRTGEDGNSRNTPFLALILVTAFQAFLSGLRWGYGVVEIMYLAPVGAALVPPLVYCGVARLAGRSNPTKPLHLGLHAVPSVAIVLLIVTWRGAIDAALPAIFIFYSVAILHLMRSGPDALRRTPFESAAPVYQPDDRQKCLAICQ